MNAWGGFLVTHAPSCLHYLHPYIMSHDMSPITAERITKVQIPLRCKTGTQMLALQCSVKAAFCSLLSDSWSWILQRCSNVTWTKSGKNYTVYARNEIKKNQNIVILATIFQEQDNSEDIDFKSNLWISSNYSSIETAQMPQFTAQEY